MLESTCLQEVQGAQRNGPCTVEYVGCALSKIRQLTYETVSFWSTGLSPAGSVGIAIIIGLRKNFPNHIQQHDFSSFVMRLVKPNPASTKASVWEHSEVLPESSCQSVGGYSHMWFSSNPETPLATHILRMLGLSSLFVAVSVD